MNKAEAEEMAHLRNRHGRFFVIASHVSSSVFALAGSLSGSFDPDQRRTAVIELSAVAACVYGILFYRCDVA